jgi:hypothetical protein
LGPGDGARVGWRPHSREEEEEMTGKMRVVGGVITGA